MKLLIENWRKFVNEEAEVIPFPGSQPQSGEQDFSFSPAELDAVNSSIAKIVNTAKKVLGAEGEIPQLEGSFAEPEMRMVAEDDDDATEEERAEAEALGITVSQLRSASPEQMSLRRQYYGPEGDVAQRGPKAVRGLDKGLGTMSATDFEEEGIVIPVPEEVLQSFRQLVADTKEIDGLYEEARDWYQSIRGLLDKETGNDQDATLLGLLVATYSPRAKFALNLAEAVFMYKAIQKDVADGKEKELKEYLETFPGAEKRSVGEPRGFTNAHKVPNFTLNLIAPELAGSRGEGGEMSYDDMYEWNSTIDTWMIDAFYPSLRKASTSKEWDNIKGKMMGNVVSYRYMARLVASEAKRLGLVPHELQALIWVASQVKQTGQSDLGVTTQFAYNQIRDSIKNVASIKEDLRALKQLEEQDWLGTIISTIDEQGFEEAGRYVTEKGQGVRSITSRGKKGSQFDYFPTPPKEPKAKGPRGPKAPKVPKPKVTKAYEDPAFSDLATWWVMNNVIQMPTGKFNNLYDSIMLYLSPDFSKEKAVQYVLGRFDPAATSSKDYFLEHRARGVKLIVEKLSSDDKSEIKKMIEKEIQKALKSKDAKEQVGDVVKKIMKKLYKDLSLEHPYIIDRIKV
mgnify:FL=1|jgi:hypothetical protein|tara:strand:- start:238 stop:2112 length:1875 start_codon:yes stop_codon:yes gene_type:complete